MKPSSKNLSLLFVKIHTFIVTPASFNFGKCDKKLLLFFMHKAWIKHRFSSDTAKSQWSFGWIYLDISSADMFYSPCVRRTLETATALSGWAVGDGVPPGHEATLWAQPLTFIELWWWLLGCCFEHKTAVKDFRKYSRVGLCGEYAWCLSKTPKFLAFQVTKILTAIGKTALLSC